MTIVATTWLGLALLLSGFAWLCVRRAAAFTLPVVTALAALAMYVPLGSPRFTAPPPGNYTVVGAKIVVDEAIYLLLDNGRGDPVYYVLPYSNSKAGELQAALDGEGQAGARVGTDGGVSYEGETPVQGGEPKQAEQPEFQPEN